MLNDLGLLILRMTVGGLLAAHGSQKLFGWFSGPGLKGISGWLGSMGLKPSKLWAYAAALSEFGGGVLTALGLFHPLGSIASIATMSMAIAKAHWGKPIWASQGGAELPLTNLATTLALALTGPGKFSLDYALGIRVPRPLVVLAALATAAGITLGVLSQPEPAPSTGNQPETATSRG
jgi:putative oxidoreductase